MFSSSLDVHYSFTVMLLGDSCTGKTCLLIRFKDNTFMNSNFIATVGIDYRNKLLNLDKHKVKLQVWDTAGQERFRSLTTSYYRDADALLLIYDVTNRNSFENIRDWLTQVKEHAKDNVQLMLVGNKADLGGAQRKVRAEEGRQLAEACKIGFMETSAKTGQNVHEVFMELSRKLVEVTNKRGGHQKRAKTPTRQLGENRQPNVQLEAIAAAAAGWNWPGNRQCCGG